MENLFFKRATEHLRDHEAFLAIVSPEPLRYFLGAPGAQGVLYDRLVLLQGTPGSGKTTLASLFEYPRLAALLRNTALSAHASLAAALSEAGAIRSGAPRVLGCRLPLETDYRDIWEFPYSPELRLALTVSLIQARAVLTWMRNLAEAGVNLTDVTILPRGDAAAAVEAIGGVTAASVQERAKRIERALYEIVGALLPPKSETLSDAVTSAYRPFDVVEGIQFRGADGSAIHLKPLVILDDAQSLHPEQFEGVRRWLARRELRVSRWLLMRLDVLNAREALAAVTDAAGEAKAPGIGAGRDTHAILLQAPEERKQQRSAFRRMARDMSSRYLQQMPLFARRNLVQLQDLLGTEPETISDSSLDDLKSKVASTQQRLGVSPRRRAVLEASVEEYAASSGRRLTGDVSAMMLSILLHRYAKRTRQRAFQFGGAGNDPEPARPVVADAAVFEAAKLMLWHAYGRSFYCGMDDLCDASSENAEQFLRLAAGLVETVAANIIRLRPSSPLLSPKLQQRHLAREAAAVMEGWDFPHAPTIRRLVDGLAQRCLEASLAPNAWLGAGANAYGITQEEFEAIPRSHPHLAEVLQFGVAYRALTLAPRYKCKDRLWCLVELGGVVKIARGLTLKRGGFLEGDAEDLSALVDQVAS